MPGFICGYHDLNAWWPMVNFNKLKQSTGCDNTVGFCHQYFFDGAVVCHSSPNTTNCHN